MKETENSAYNSTTDCADSYRLKKYNLCKSEKSVVKKESKK